MNHNRRQVRDDLRALASGQGWDSRVQAQADGYVVTGLSPGDVEYTDADWNGSDAEAKYPDPSDEDTDLDFLADHYLLVPEDLDEDDRPSKSDFKGPFRMGPGRPASTQALLANIQAINGARGGFEGVSRDTLEEAYQVAVEHLVEAGEYDDADDAPEMDIEAASVPEIIGAAEDGRLTASAPAENFQDGPDATVRLSADAADGDDAGLAGIVWGAGDHDLSLGGRPTPVRVPAETIRPTFEAMKEDIASGDVTLGFDHPGPDSVAARTGIVDIGTADGVGLSADEQYIVLTDSTLTNDQAAKAAEAGDFDDLDWSVVADVAVRRDDSGQPVMEDGRIVVDATRIQRIDAVDTGAVDAASIERSKANLPDLAEQADTVRQAAAGHEPTTDAVQALKASATAYSDTTDMGNRTFNPEVGDGVPDDVREQLNAAADIIDDQEDELEAARAKADGFQSLLQAHGLDEDDFETPQAAAQAVIDEQTEDTRREIAEIEADLAKYDVDDIEARAEELAGTGPADLTNTLNARKAEAFDRQQKAQQKGRAAAQDDATGRANFSGGRQNDSGDADEIALAAMDGQDRIQAEVNGEDPAEYIREEYGLEAGQYDAADALHADIMDEINGGDA